MKNIYLFILGSICTLIVISCNRNEDLVNPADSIELYLLESYETVEGTCIISESSCKIETVPVISYSDFISYNSTNYTFEITNEAIEAVNNLEHSLSGLAFAITADREIIYTGYFWPMISSLACNWTTISPDIIEFSNEMRVNLGYPAQTEGVSIDDKRNHPIIISTFKRDGKLIE